MWRNGPNSIVASARKPTTFKLVNLFMSDAMRPADHSKLVTVEIDNSGSVAFAVGVGDNTVKCESKKTNDSIFLNLHLIK